jgi:hypothetical protein
MQGLGAWFVGFLFIAYFTRLSRCPRCGGLWTPTRHEGVLRQPDATMRCVKCGLEGRSRPSSAR